MLFTSATHHHRTTTSSNNASNLVGNMLGWFLFLNKASFLAHYRHRTRHGKVYSEDQTPKGGGRMSKKLLIILGTVTVVICLAFLFCGRGKFCTLRELVPMAPVAFQPQSSLKTLRDDLLLVSWVSPRNLDPAIQWLQSLRDNLRKSKIWNSFEVEKHFLDNFEKGFNAGAGDDSAENRLPQFQEFLSIVQDLWWATDEILIAVSGETIKLGGELDFTPGLVELVITKQEPIKKLMQLVDTHLLSGQEEFKNDDFSIRKGGIGKPYTIHLAHLESTETIGALLFNERSVQLTIGTENVGALQAKDQAKSFGASPKWKGIQEALLPKSAFAFYLEPKVITTLMTKIAGLAALTPDGQTSDIARAQEMISKTFGDLTSQLSSGAAYRALEGKTCVSVVSGSPLETLYNQWLGAKNKSSGKHRFTKLIGERTIVAGELFLGGSLVMIDYLKHFYGFDSSDSSSPEFAMIEQAIAKIEPIVKKLAIEDIGVLVNSPFGSPIPEGGMLLGGSVLEGKTLFAEVETVVKDILAQLDPSGSAVTVKSLTSQSGKDLIQLTPTDGQFAVYGGVVDSHSFLFGLSENFIEEGERLMAAEDAYFDSLASALGKGISLLKGSDYFWYVNTQPAFQMLKPFIPMVLAQKPDAAIELADIDQFLQIFTGGVLMSQKSFKESTDRTCTESFLTTVSAPLSTNR